MGLKKLKELEIKLFPHRLSAVLDKCKISNRDYVHILTAVLDAISIDPSEYIINRTSIKFARKKVSSAHF